MTKMRWVMVTIGVFLVVRSGISLWQISRLRSRGVQATAQLIVTDETHHEFGAPTGRFGEVRHHSVYAAAPAWQFTTAGGREIVVPTTVTNDELEQHPARSITYLPDSPEVARLTDEVEHPFWPWTGLLAGAGLVGLTLSLRRRRSA